PILPGRGRGAPPSAAESGKRRDFHVVYPDVNASTEQRFPPIMFFPTCRSGCASVPAFPGGRPTPAREGRHAPAAPIGRGGRVRLRARGAGRRASGTPAVGRRGGSTM